MLDSENGATEVSSVKNTGAGTRGIMEIQPDEYHVAALHGANRHSRVLSKLARKFGAPDRKSLSYRVANGDKKQDWLYNDRADFFKLIGDVFMYMEDAVGFMHSPHEVIKNSLAPARKNEMIVTARTNVLDMLARGFSSHDSSFGVTYNVNKGAKIVELVLRKEYTSSMKWQEFTNYYEPHFNNYFSRLKVSPNVDISKKANLSVSQSVAPVDISMESPAWAPLDDLRRLGVKPKVDPDDKMVIHNGTIDMPEKPDERKLWDMCQFKIDFIGATVPIVYYAEKDFVMRDSQYFTCNFGLSMRISLPMQLAMWLNYASKPDEISIPDVHNVLKAYLVSVLTARRRNKNTIQRIMPLPMSLGILDQKIKDSYTKIKPRVFNNITVLANGTYLFVPPYTNTDEYVKSYNASYNPETGLVNPPSSIQELHNKFLFADWYHNAYLYTNATGAINTFDLNGSSAPTLSMFYRILKQSAFTPPFFQDSMAFLDVGTALCTRFKLIEEAIKRLGISDHSHWSVATFREVVTEALQTIHNANSDLATMLNINAPQWAEENRKDDRLTSRTGEFVLRLLVEVCHDIYNMVTPKNIDGLTFSSLAKSYLTFMLIGHVCYNPKMLDNGKADYEKDKIRNSVPPMAPDEIIRKSIAVPNLPGLNSLLPHQTVMVENAFAKHPDYTVMDISPGGGKSISFLIQILKGIESGSIKRACIICPAQLMKSWMNEVNKFSDGRLNPFCITTETFKKLSYLGFKDERAVFNYLTSLPLNTIFITNYNFLKNQSFFSGSVSSVQYSDQEFDFYPNAHFLMQMEFTYIGVDESHKIKNVNAMRSRATRNVISYTPQRSIGSGTILYNTPGDIIGQVGLINPALLGNLDDIIKTGSITDSYGKITGMRGSVSKYVMDLVTPFVSWNVARRRDWQFMLPPVTYNYLRAEMTPNQQSYYIKMLQDAIGEMTNDPTILKIFQSGDEEKIEKIQKSIDVYLARVEIFMNAPASSGLFAEASSTKDEDLIPPKTKMVNAVIDAHRNGGKVTDASGMSVEFQASTHRIIVLAYNRAVSTAIYQHLDPRYKQRFVHYQATPEGEKNLIRFMQDPNVWGMVADETSIGEGFNFQHADAVIRLQALWTPGGEEQALSRVLRPDVAEQFERKGITITTIICNKSLDIPKTARNIAKKVMNMKLAEGNRGDWNAYIKNNTVPDLPLIKMGLKLLEKYSSQDLPVNTVETGTTSLSIGTYFKAFEGITKWDYQQGQNYTVSLRNAVAKKLGVTPEEIKIKELRRLCRASVDGSAVLKGSQHCYIPYIPGVSVIPEKMGLNLSALAILKPDQEDADDENDSEENEGEIVENVSYAVGDLVVTEFGFGFIYSIPPGKQNVVGVIIPGFRNAKVVQLRKTIVFKPLNTDLAEKIGKKLDRLAENGRGIIFFPKSLAAMSADEILSKSYKGKKLGAPEKELTALPPSSQEIEHPAAKPGNVVKKPVPVKEEPIEHDEEDDTDSGKQILDDDEGEDTGIHVNVPKEEPVGKPGKKIKPAGKSLPPKEPEIDEDEIIRAKNLNRNTKERVANSMHKQGLLFHYSPSTGVSALVDLAVINGLISMATYPIEGHFDKLEAASERQWDMLSSFGFIHVKSYQGAKNLVDVLEENFTLLPNTDRRILNLAQALRGKSAARLAQSGPLTFQNLKNFIRVNHTNTEAPDELKVYPVIWDGNLYVCALRKIQPKAFNRFTKLRVQGCDRAQVNNPSSAYLFFHSRQEALKELKEINRGVHVVNYDDLVKELETDPVYRNLVSR